MQKVVSDARFSSDSAGAALTYTVALGDIGGAAKQVMIMAVIKQSSGANVRLFLQLLHSPNNFIFTKHSDLVGTAGTPVAINTDNLMVGDSDAAVMLGDYLNLAFTINDSAASSEQWVVVDIYVSAKPF